MLVRLILSPQGKTHRPGRGANLDVEIAKLETSVRRHGLLCSPIQGRKDVLHLWDLSLTS